MTCSIARAHGDMIAPVSCLFSVDDDTKGIMCHVHGGPGDSVDFRMRYGWDGYPIPVNHGLEPIHGCYRGVLANFGWDRREDEYNLVEGYTKSFWENSIDCHGLVTMDTWRDYPNNHVVHVGSMLNGIVSRLLPTWNDTRPGGNGYYDEGTLHLIGKTLGLIKQTMQRFGPAGIDLMRIIADNHGEPDSIMGILTSRMNHMGTILTVLLHLDSMYAIHGPTMNDTDEYHNDTHSHDDRTVSGVGLVPRIPVLAPHDLARLKNGNTLEIQVGTVITGETDDQSTRLMWHHSTVTRDTIHIMENMMNDEDYMETMTQMIEMMHYVTSDTVDWNEYPTLIKPYLNDDEQYLLHDAAEQSSILNRILCTVITEWEQTPIDNHELLKNTVVTLIAVLNRYMDSPNYINDEALKAGADLDDYIPQSYEDVVNDAIINVKNNFLYIPMPDHDQLIEWYTLPSNVMHEEYEQYKESIGYK